MEIGVCAVLAPVRLYWFMDLCEVLQQYNIFCSKALGES